MSGEDRSEDWFHLWAKVHGIQQEAKPFGFGTPNQHITLDHIYEEATTALDLIDSLRSTPAPVESEGERVSVPIPEWEALRDAVRRRNWWSSYSGEVQDAALALVAAADRGAQP